MRTYRILAKHRFLEFDSARTALVSIDFQIDFCGEKGYVDVMGYPLSNTANPFACLAGYLTQITYIKV